MNKATTAVFIGHSDAPDSVYFSLKSATEKLIKQGVTCFLNGGMGRFDMQCMQCINELKNDYPFIKHYLILPYLNFKRCGLDFFDDSIYPGFESIPPKIAILKRNEWMIKNSMYALCFVNRSFGGAAKTYKLAEKNNLIIINL